MRIVHKMRERESRVISRSPVYLLFLHDNTSVIYVTSVCKVKHIAKHILTRVIIKSIIICMCFLHDTYFLQRKISDWEHVVWLVNSRCWLFYAEQTGLYTGK